jgi:hypothetical protein
VAGICTSDVKAEELDSPLAWGAGVVGGSVPTAGAAAAECVIGGREESDKSSRASSTGKQRFSGNKCKRGAGIVRVGAVKEAVGNGADTAKMVEGGRKEKNILVDNKRDWTQWKSWQGCNVFLICYGVVAGFNVGDEKPPHD